MTIAISTMTCSSCNHTVTSNDAITLCWNLDQSTCNRCTPRWEVRRADGGYVGTFLTEDRAQLAAEGEFLWCWIARTDAKDAGYRHGSSLGSGGWDQGRYID